MPIRESEILPIECADSSARLWREVNISCGMFGWISGGVIEQCRSWPGGIAYARGHA